MGLEPVLNADIKLLKRNKCRDLYGWWDSLTLFMEAQCFCLECKCLWRGQFGCCLYPAAFASAATVHPIGQSCAHLQWHYPLHICQQQQQISFSTPSVTKLRHSHSVLSLINQPGNTHIFLWPSEREFIIRLLTKSGTPQAVLATAREVTHILLIYWHDILDKAK